MVKTRLFVLPRKTGLIPTGTTPTLESPEISMCMSLPSADGRGFVESVMACARALGSPVGGGTGTMNWRKVSLQPIASSNRANPQMNIHNALRRDFIKTPPDYRLNAKTRDYCEVFIVAGRG